METTTALPAWIGTTQLDTSPLPKINSLAITIREEEVFQSIWPTYIDRTYQGHLLVDILSDDPRQIHTGRFRRWIDDSSERKKMASRAERVGADAVMEDAQKISDAEHSMEDVARSTVRVNIRRTRAKASSPKYQDQPAQSENSMAGGITINIGAVQSPYAAPITTIEQEPLVLENLSNE